LSHVEFSRDRLDEATKLAREVLEVREQCLPPTSPGVRRRVGRSARGSRSGCASTPSPPVSQQSTKPPVAAGPPPEPLPPPIPPIPLKFMGTVEKPGLMLAALTDCKGYAYAAREGEVVDGRYRVVKIQVESVILEYSNGTGRTTVRKSGDCPRTP